ncbi:late embryogenesis abundant protein At1g64065-like [Primulina huaijiensis]|uniref:late embryogenesis abundant protein At1g64065-like n=1 Tax=Primulina huaijiensis TaxID=1492673 RepID=UPI003CC77DFB
MADPKQQVYPLAPATMPRSDQESATNYRSEQAMKKKKRMKCLAYIAAFAVLQTIVIVVFSVVFLRFKTPKVRMEQVTITNIGNGNIVSFSARVTVKNTNYGRYKFDSSLATITSGNGVVLGQLAIPEERAGARSTKRILVVGDLASPTGDSNGNLAVTIAANLRGKVEILRIIKRKKSADMLCTMTINLPTNSVQDLACK